MKPYGTTHCAKHEPAPRKIIKENYLRIPSDSTPLTCHNFSCLVCQYIKTSTGDHIPKACFAALVWNYANDENKPVILMITENRGNVNVPGGNIDFDTCYWRALVREVEEESGLDISEEYNKIIGMFFTVHKERSYLTFIVHSPHIKRSVVNAEVYAHNHNPKHRNKISYHEIRDGGAHTVDLHSVGNILLETDGTPVNEENNYIPGYVISQLKMIRDRALE